MLTGRALLMQNSTLIHFVQCGLVRTQALDFDFGIFQRRPIQQMVVRAIQVSVKERHGVSIDDLHGTCRLYWTSMRKPLDGRVERAVAEIHVAGTLDACPEALSVAGSTSHPGYIF